MRKHIFIEVATSLNKIEVGPNNQGISHLEYVELEAVVTLNNGEFHWKDKFSQTRFAKKDSSPEDWGLNDGIEESIIQMLTWLELISPTKTSLDTGSLKDWLPKGTAAGGRFISDLYGNYTTNLGVAFWNWLKEPNYRVIGSAPNINEELATV